MAIFRSKMPREARDRAELQDIYERHYLSQQVFLRRGNLSQRELAALAGMTQPQIARLEAGRENPTHSTLVKLAVALECKIADLYTPLPGEELGDHADRAAADRLIKDSRDVWIRYYAKPEARAEVDVQHVDREALPDVARHDVWVLRKQKA